MIELLHSISVLAIIAITVAVTLLSGIVCQRDSVTLGIAILGCILAYWQLDHLSAVLPTLHAPQLVFDALAWHSQQLLVLAMVTYLLVLSQYRHQSGFTMLYWVVLSLFCLLGMMITVSTTDMIVLYLAIELMAFPMYAMCVIDHSENKLCIEAALKFFMLGALSTGIMLYGFSLLFAATGGHDLALWTQSDNLPLMSIGLALTLCGIAFKLGLAPFHMWLPDVYDGAPLPGVLLISSLPKLVYAVLLYRIMSVSAFFPWHDTLMILAVFSIIIGNMSALAQERLRRMMAYSSIAHMGYFLLALVVADAWPTSMLYILIYVFSSFVFFAALTQLRKGDQPANLISDLNGLSTINPRLAFTFLLVIFSMAGLPPLVGFVTKFSIFHALIRGQEYALALTGMVFAIFAVYYYIRVIRTMYFNPPSSDEQPLTSKGSLTAVITQCGGVLIILLGLIPAPLFTLIDNIM